MKKTEKALCCFDKALELNSKHVLSSQKKSEILRNLGHDKEATKLKPPAIQTVNGIAFTSTALPPQNTAAFISSGNPKIQSDADIRLQDAHFWRRKGKQFCDEGKYNEAILCFTELLQLEPQSAFAWSEKAFCEDKLNRLTDSIYSYKQALNFADDSLQLIQNAAACLNELERTQNRSILKKKTVNLSTSSSAIKRTYVDSSNLKSVGYDRQNKILEVEFNGGAVYQYYAVPQQIYVELMKAESHGRYFYAFIRNCFQYNQIGYKPVQNYRDGEDIDYDVEEIDPHHEALGIWIDNENWVSYNDD